VSLNISLSLRVSVCVAVPMRVSVGSVPQKESLADARVTRDSSACMWVPRDEI